MDQVAQNRLREVLARTLEDERLSRAELASLTDLVEELTDDRDALAFFRNEAFRQAKQAIEASPVAVLAWLQRVDKIVDQAARPRSAATAFEHVAFSPGGGCLSLIRSSIGAARTSVDVCVFTVTDDRISKALLAAHQRGVRVRIVTDDEKAGDTGSDIHRLREAGVPVRTDRGAEHMHHKFAVIDGRLLLNGSYNWTRGATGNHENLHATTDPAPTAAFQRRFDQLWASFRP